MNRRAMLLRTALATAWFQFHDEWAGPRKILDGGHLETPLEGETCVAGGAPRIRAIHLRTQAPLESMKQFYGETIGFLVVDEAPDRITFQAGGTRLSFTVEATSEAPQNAGRIDKAGVGNGQPFYHFAFNIPENKILAARAWQLKRTALVPTPPQLLDPQFPGDVRHFAQWNAHSIFFFDPAFNIVEYIARHELSNTAPDPDAFSVEDLLYASEIGLVVDRREREAIARKVGEHFGLPEYPRGATPWAMGDAHGLLLLLGNLGDVWGDNSPTPVRWGIFPTDVVLQGSSAPADLWDELPYRISAE